jgi:hypothetical protein
MRTECNRELIDFGSVEGRRVVVGFDGGRVTSDARREACGPSIPLRRSTFVHTPARLSKMRKQDFV